jgi:MscS family membrane protein
MSNCFRWISLPVITAVAWFGLGALQEARVAAQPTIADVLGAKTPAEPNQSAAEGPRKEVPFDEHGRGTPRSAVEGFLAAASARQWERAALYLDVRQLPRSMAGETGPGLARQLKVVLDRTLWVDIDALSDDPAGHGNDGLPANRDRIGRIELPSGKKVDVLLQRVPGEGGQRIWQFSSVTVAQIPELYAHFGYAFEPYLPEFLFEIEIARVPLIEWIGLLAFALIGFVAAYVFTAILNWLLRRRRTPVATQLARFVTGPMRLLIGVSIFTVGARLFHLILPVQVLLDGLERAAFVIAVAWTALRLADAFGATLSQRLLQRGQANLIGLIPPGRNIAKFVITIFAGIAMLNSFGFNVTALLAGLGVGGIAVALSAQKTLENVFGGFTLFANRPAQVGDFCRFGDKVGTIEEIGLYSSRIRSLDRTVITVPNAEFSALQIENFTRRDKIWYHPTIGLRYETSPEQIRYILVEIRKMLYAHPNVDPDPARIRFTGFGAYSLDLEIFAYVRVTDFGQFLEVAEDLNLRIMDIVAAAGSSFAFPSQTTYIENGQPLDTRRAQEVASTVKQWRERQELYIPRFPPEKINELRGTLDFPPAGSPLARTAGDGGR